MTTTPIHISRRVDPIAFAPPKTPNDVLAAPCAVLVTETSQPFGEFVSLRPRAPRQPSNPGHNLPRLGAQFDEMKSHLAGTSLLALPRVPSGGLSALKLGQVLQKGPQPLDDFSSTAVGTGEWQCHTASRCTVSIPGFVPGVAQFSRARVRRSASNAAPHSRDRKPSPRGQRLGSGVRGWPSALPSRS